jgi:hypothetical protein
MTAQQWDRGGRWEALGDKRAGKLCSSPGASGGGAENKEEEGAAATGAASARVSWGSDAASDRLVRSRTALSRGGGGLLRSLPGAGLGPVTADRRPG